MRLVAKPKPKSDSRKLQPVDIHIGNAPTKKRISTISRIKPRFMA